MKIAWLTYAWKDNEGAQQGDVDFIVNEIEKHDVGIRMDRRDLIVGKPLWPQIETHISDEAMCDAWIFLITRDSLARRPCREELLYALNRALDKRKKEFPVIGIFRGEFPTELPKALSVRVCVSTDEQKWAERVAAGVRAESIPISPAHVSPFHAHLCNYGDTQILEVRPRLGNWSPFCFGVTKVDADRILSVNYAPSTGEPPDNCRAGHHAGGVSSPLHAWEKNGWMWNGVAGPAVSPSMSAHIWLNMAGRSLKIQFGPKNQAMFTLELQP